MTLTPSGTRQLLEELGHLPNKRLGQNFLIDGNIVRKSVELAKVTKEDIIVEIGPGLGTLTTSLLATGATVYAIEMDKALFQHLMTEVFPMADERLHLIEGDALDHPLANFSPSADQPFKIVANLPYAISTPWIEKILTVNPPEKMVLMLQTETAQRYVSTEGSKQFGSISIFLQSVYDTNLGHKVASSCFYPKPDVGSSLLCLERKKDIFLFSKTAKTLIRNLFQHRRKQLGARLKTFPEESGTKWLNDLEENGFSAQNRAEDIPISLWQKLNGYL
ncbi:MAG: ribosomal RNA small subunit methyltransferase A [Opitutaceae bacterium]|nr:ribosomal RNA small subunit methyltransferase A [Opitutaceae bacterium]